MRRVIELLRPDELDAATVESPHELWQAAFGGDFTAEDAGHAFGGVHAIIRDERRVVSHASAVRRIILIGERPCRAGYVEAVATLPELQRHGLGSQVMSQVNAAVASDYEIGVLSTSRGFYERLGWERWRSLVGLTTQGGGRVGL